MSLHESIRIQYNMITEIHLNIILRNKETKFLSTNLYISRYGTRNRLFCIKIILWKCAVCFSKRPKNSVQRPPPPATHPKKSNTVSFHYKNPF
jgi:hypothetical protein